MLYVICTRLSPGQLSVRVGDISRCSEILKKSRTTPFSAIIITISIIVVTIIIIIIIIIIMCVVICRGGLLENGNQFVSDCDGKLDAKFLTFGIYIPHCYNCRF